MQSSQAQFEKLTTALTSLGFYRSQVDHSVFVIHSARGMIALVVYVDDIVITGDDGLGMSINSVCDENVPRQTTPLVS